MEAATNQSAKRSLHICPECGGALVQPTSWEQEGNRSHWRLTRRCPECEWAGEGIHDDVAVDAYDEQLDLGSHELADELRTLEHANMSEMANAFVIALWKELITAEDFRV